MTDVTPIRAAMVSSGAGVDNSLEDFVRQAFAEVDLDWRDHTVISNSLFRPTDISNALPPPNAAF
jgi:GDPmannose 4,6-dehydratase